MATRKGKSLIDQICSNIPNKLVHTIVILTDEISVHDTRYVTVNIKKEQYEPRYKYIRHERKTDVKNCSLDERPPHCSSSKRIGTISPKSWRQQKH